MVKDANFFFSLRYLGIIQAGDHTVSEESRARVPSELLEATNELLEEEIEDIFVVRYELYYNNWFSALVS